MQINTKPTKVQVVSGVFYNAGPSNRGMMCIRSTENWLDAGLQLSYLDAGVAGRTQATNTRVAFVRGDWRSGPECAVIPGSTQSLRFGEALAPTEPAGYA